MAIGFARFEFVQRSAGKTACGKAAYNARDKVYFEGTKFAESKTYDWSHKEKAVYHEVFLPEHVDAKFKSVEILWNTVEQKENRRHSQVAMEMVIALPDDKVISLEDKIELTKTFVEEHFIKQGLAAQVNIHRPDHKILLSIETGEVEDLDHNWHAHILVPTRRFHENGQELDDYKARDLMPVVRGGRVVSGVNWGKLWSQHQNQFFEERGLDLRVDETGIIAQRHLGPVRLRHRAFALEEENQMLTTLNKIESKDPDKILDKITQTRSVFTLQDVERYMHKHLAPDEVEQTRDIFWKQEQIIQLVDAKTSKLLNKFTTKEILEEESQILRLADGLQKSHGVKLKIGDLDGYTRGLSIEQKQAFDQIIQGRKLNCIEGHAGTGKSYLLSSLRDVYQQQGCIVRAFGPDNATANVLNEKGFESSENIYRFLFSLHHGKREISKGKEIWFLDEASKLGNRPLLEFLKAAEKHQVQLIFSGCSSQLSSVERGGLFKLFCERYGAQELVEIQRQKKQEQRLMAQNLARGNMAAAIDQLTHVHGLKWHETKGEAVEALIKTWAVDQTAFPENTSLILAHTNAEMRILNELARLYRKEKGELEHAEFVCKTAKGKIIVSVGDKIELRANNKELGITNGMMGTLIEASPDHFVVALQDQSRKITFNPTEYTGFQLGYATTYFRSQGKTVDRAYVLHSPQMNKEKFYVGLTRHVHKAILFVSSSEVLNISDLKRQAFRKDFKENTLNYQTEDLLKQQQESFERARHIEELKDSSSLVGKAKGYTMGSWDLIKNTVQERIRYRRDLRPSREFFSYSGEVNNARGIVVKIDDQHFDFDQKRRQHIHKTFIKVIEKIEPVAAFAGQAKNMRGNWDCLSKRNKALMNQYYQTLNQASTLYSVVRSEAGSADLKNAAHFKDWQNACTIRNAQAFEVLNAVPQTFIKEAIGKEAFVILQDRALKHEMSMRKQQDQHLNITEEIKNRLEILLYRLFPEGPTRRDRQGLRFGSKGSLSVILQGSHKGCFYDFEKGEGGGPLQLIQRALHLQLPQAKEWAAEFLGQSTEIKVPSQFIHQSRGSPLNQEWFSLKPEAKFPAPSLKELPLVLDKKYHEAARHAYRNESGDLLFYTLRLIEKNDPTKKCVLPLSFGKWEGSENPTWAMKSYQESNRTLYHLDKLSNDRSATVLVVEGEKAADAAQKLFLGKNLICISWQGGASAVAKSDWFPLYGRRVVVWPDNDHAGFIAADKICSELRQVGVKSLSIVDKNELSRSFPEKWDLADPMPQGISIPHIQDMLLMAREKSVGIDQLVQFFKRDEKAFTVDHLRAQEILWRVEERLWPNLEEIHGSRVWEIKQAILNETEQIICKQDSLIKKLRLNEQFDVKLAGLIANQLALQQAERGSLSIDNQVNELKKVAVLRSNISFCNDYIGKDMVDYALDKSFVEAMSIGMTADILKYNIRSVVAENEVKITKQALIHREQVRDQDKQKEKGVEFEL